MECPGRDLPKHPMPGSWGRPRQGRLERSARHEGSPAGIRFPGGVMMLFVFSWPATTRPSCALRCGIETQCAVRRRLSEPPPKSPGTVAGESAAGEETATMLRRHCGLRRTKCVRIGSNSTTGHLGASGGRTARLNAISNRPRFASTREWRYRRRKTAKIWWQNWRQNLAAMSAGVSDNNQRPVFAFKRAFGTRRSTSGRRPERSLGTHCGDGRYGSFTGHPVAKHAERRLRSFRYARFRPNALNLPEHSHTPFL